MRSLAVLVLIGALLALLAGCNSDISPEDVQSKEGEIEGATLDLMGVDEIPEDEKRD